MKDKTNSIGELTSLLLSRTFHLILEEHKSYLQKEVNRFVKAQDMTNAFASLAKLEDIDKLVGLMQRKLEELRK